MVSKEQKELEQKLAKWLFDNTDTIYWDLQGYDLSEAISSYGDLVIPPESVLYDEDELVDAKRCLEKLHDKAKDIISLLAESGLGWQIELHDFRIGATFLPIEKESNNE